VERYFSTIPLMLTSLGGTAFPPKMFGDGFPPRLIVLEIVQQLHTVTGCHVDTRLSEQSIL